VTGSHKTNPFGIREKSVRMLLGGRRSINEEAVFAGADYLRIEVG